MTTERIRKLSNDYYDKIVNIRHEIHEHPELGYEEHQTAQLIIEVLTSLDIEIKTNIAKTGVVGLIKGNGPGKTVLLRADMDALPIQEDTDVLYKSIYPNRMHACGHDGHVAGLLGAAMVLCELRDMFVGNVKLIFQPAEETEGGASNMIKEGVLENPPVDAAFGCHLWGDLMEGKVQLCPGPMMAAQDSFKFVIHGKGGHGGLPHLALDPIVLAAQAISAIQLIVSRRINPLEPATVTIASIHGGNADNVIPEYLEATGTIRTFSESLRDLIPKEIARILKGVTEAHGATYSFEVKKIIPPLVNDPFMSGLMHEAFSKIVGAKNVNANGSPSMGSEDFSYFCNSVPSAFALIGIAKDLASPVLHHSSRFQWEDENLLVLTEGLVQTALDFLSLS